MQSEIRELSSSLDFATDRLTPAEWRDRWLDLYGRCFASGSWSVSITDAWHAIDVGTTHALCFHDYREVIALAERFLAHPRASRAQWPVPEHVNGRLAQALVLVGEVERGASVFEAKMETNKARPKDSNQDVAMYLLNVLNGLGDEAPADPRIKAVAARLISTWPGHREPRAAVLRADSIGEVRRLLESTRLSNTRKKHSVPGADIVVWNEWDRITWYPHTNYMTPEKALAYYSLFQRCLADGKWRVSIGDAMLVTRSVLYVPFHTKRFRDALPYIELYHEHPDLAAAKAGEARHLEACIAAVLVLAGQADHGLRAIERIAAHPHERDALGVIQMISEERGDDRIDPKLSALARRLAASPGIKKKHAKAIAASRTYRELAEALKVLW